MTARAVASRLDAAGRLASPPAGADGAVADHPGRVAVVQGVIAAQAERPDSDVVRHWQLSDRADPVTARIADRHYNRQKIGSAQFVPPGRCLVLRTATGDAFWVTSWPLAEHVQHEWAGAWVCTAFRNESPHLSSDLIREAVAATLAYWHPPALGMVTFVDATKTRRKRDPGRCFRRAGFAHVGYTKGGLYALQLLPDAMPEPVLPGNAQPELWSA